MARLPVRGVSFVAGEHDEEETRRIMRALRAELGCTAVMPMGDDVDALVLACRTALEEGLAVWVRPHLPDRRRRALQQHLRRVAAAAEELRLAHPGRVTLMVGTEFSLTSPGMIPGPRVFVRVQVLMRWRRWFDRRIRRRLDPLLRAMAATARSEFQGPVAYGAAYWEEVDWSPFDVVGINLYRLGRDPDGYARRVRELVATQDKPVVITEFGCGSFRGADVLGPASFRAAKWFSERPHLRDGIERDESVQASYVGELIDLYADAGVHGCFVFTFLMSDFPRDDDPAHDLDTAGFGLVSVPAGDPTDWRPKQAYREVARRFRALG